MNNDGFSGKPQNTSPTPGEDIPEALRDTPDTGPRLRARSLVLIIVGTFGFILLATVSGFFFFITVPQQSTTSNSSPTSSTPVNASELDTSVEPSPKSDTVLGHLPYQEAPESDLAPISPDGRIRMRTTAAQKFRQMVREARSAGVTLVAISGFRSVTEQEQLFFTIGQKRNQTPAQRAALSAPPGYSEHHTGYAVDIGDGAVPATHLSVNFEKTKAFQWLEANAARFGFELSFPKDNSQGVSYEPWHWRYVGDRDSLETFYKARNAKPAPISP